MFALLPQSFLENSHPAIQSLESLQARAMEEFSKVASYFGEDSKSTRTEAFFGIFTEFISKFEVSFFRTFFFLNVIGIWMNFLRLWVLAPPESSERDAVSRKPQKPGAVVPSGLVEAR